MNIRNRKGQFVRNPVSSEQFWDRVSTLVSRLHSMREAEQIAADEFRLVLLMDKDGLVCDWIERDWPSKKVAA